ncbi:NIPSNAP family protein [Pseudooceanicola sp.]|uniref:NIPSNAP family protein n=1 Tax=Pseudooceanicola sp. TaxID=1914328 RepID=UPI003515E4C0
MIFDHRTYTCRPGTIKKHLKLYAEHGYAPQCRHLGKPLLYGAVETGDVNSYVHVWVYKDAADRAARRSAMAADPEWQAFLKLSAEAGNLVSQVNQIITPTEFYDMPEIG